MSAILFSNSYKYCKVESSFTKKAEEMLPVPHTCTVCLWLLCTGILEKTTAEPWLVGESEQLYSAFFLIPCVCPAECLWSIQAGRICAQLQQHWSECALLLVIELHGCLLLATAASAAAECETESFGKLRPSPIIFGGELADLELDLEFGAPPSSNVQSHIA